ncbi:MAG: formyltransferase family protein, partial [Alphaproteobacteria bacterium]
MQSSLSFYVITEGNLGIECTEILLSEGHDVLGIISSHQDTADWALSHKIPYYSTLEEFADINPSKTFDYLLSIINTQILSQQLIEYPRYYAINYHDAPLPNYAGVHATSWAILNNEKNHGVTWHVMNSHIDAGDILKQVSFPIESDETALTLNLKCYSHALKTFKDLLQHLIRGPVSGKKPNLKNRRYFSRSQKPSNLGFLSWKDSAQAIERQFRALNFGDYPNGLATFKIMFNEQTIIPNKLKVLNSKSDFRPGTIIKIEEQDIYLSTTTQDICISGLRWFNDIVPNTTNSIVKDLKVHSGYKLKNPKKQMLKKLQEISSQLSPYENYWTEYFMSSPQIQYPFLFSLLKKDERVENKGEHVSEIIISDSFFEYFSYCNFSASFSETFITAFLIYLCRLGDYSPFSVGLINSFL